MYADIKGLPAPTFYDPAVEANQVTVHFAADPVTHLDQCRGPLAQNIRDEPEADAIPWIQHGMNRMLRNPD